MKKKAKVNKRWWLVDVGRGRRRRYRRIERIERTTWMQRQRDLTPHYNTSTSTSTSTSTYTYDILHATHHTTPHSPPLHPPHTLLLNEHTHLDLEAPTCRFRPTSSSLRFRPTSSSSSLQLYCRHPKSMQCFPGGVPRWNHCCLLPQAVTSDVVHAGAVVGI